MKHGGGFNQLIVQILILTTTTTTAMVRAGQQAGPRAMPSLRPPQGMIFIRSPPFLSLDFCEWKLGLVTAIDVLSR